jgi:predicted Ser/Thr protein kinase
LQIPFKEQQMALSKSWPSPQDYNEALQYPSHCFSDPDLAAGVTELNNLGLPRPRSGMFACVYKVSNRNLDWAVRCFLQPRADQVRRYIQIRDSLQRASLPCAVAFDLQEQGIQVAGQSFPMLKMEWCHGEPLNYWLARNLRNKPALEDFLENWRITAGSLAAAGIAHGDLQHGNILVHDGQIKLVDYDGMYVPEFKGMPATELGHRNYQHPQRNSTHFGPYLDNFSAWLIYISVLISGCDPHIWHDFEGGDECLLFRRQDLDDPMSSELFHVLEHHHNPQIRESSRTLRYLLTLSPENVPGLEAPVTVPEDLPELDSIISDLPEWLSFEVGAGDNSAGTSASAINEPIAHGGKRLVRRLRRRVVLPNISGEQAIRGRWAYDEDGLAFNPASNTPAAVQANTSLSGSTKPSSAASAPALHSPLLHTTTTPAPYRNINGRLHSPILDEDSFIREVSEDPLFTAAEQGLSGVNKDTLDYLFPSWISNKGFQLTLFTLFIAFVIPVSAAVICGLIPLLLTLIYR